MEHWEVLPPPEVDPVCTELECPQVCHVGERHYLIFSAAPEFFSQAFQAQHASVLQDLSSYAMVGDSWFGPFHIHGSGRIIPPDYPITPYANQIVFWQGRSYLFGTVWNDEQDFICNPIPVAFTATGIEIVE
jgi:hypothetical protein